MAFNFSPKVVTDGLVIYMDAANPKSIISGSTTWNDLSRNKINTTLVTGGTYNPSNLGCLTYDGIDDYAKIGPPVFTMAPNNVTMLFWIFGNYQGYYLGVADRIPSFTSAGITTPIPNNGWVQVGYSSSGSTNFFIMNGIRYQQNTSARYIYDNPTDKAIYSASLGYFGGPSSDNFCFSLQSAQAGFGGSYVWNDMDYRVLGMSSTNPTFRFFQGNIASVMIYNKTLSTDEITQNYNATKSRFGR